MRQILRCLVYLAVLGLLGSSTTRAANLIKDNNATNLNLAGSWVGGVVPGSSDVAQWDSTVTTANTVLLGSDLSWQGLAVVNPGGVVTINAGNTLTLGSSGIDLSTATQNLTLNNAVALGAAQTWNVNTGRRLAVSGTLSGTSGLIKDGGGAVSLSGILSYAGDTTNGDTTVNAGMLILERASVIFPGTGSTGQFNSAHKIVVKSGATLQVNQSWVTGDGQTNQVQVEGGTLQFANGDNYLSKITLTGGAITTRTSGAPWRTGYFGPGVITVNASAASSTISGVLWFVGSAAGPTTTFNVADGAATDDLVVSATIVDHAGFEGQMALVKSGAGKMVLSGANTYTGATRISGGTLQLSGGNNRLATATAVTLDNVAGAVLDLNNYSQQIGSLSGGGTSGGNVTLGSGTLTVGNATSTSYSGIISGAGGLVKQGTGTLTLGGVNTYTGGTTVNGGTLKLAAGAWGTGIVRGTATVNNTGTLEIAGAFPLNGTDTVNVNGGGILKASTAASQDSENYVGTVRLDSSNGLAAQVTTSSGSGFRMGYLANGLITSAGSIANTWSAELRLVNGSSKTMTINTAAGNTLLLSGVINDFSTLKGTPVFKTGEGTLVLSGANTYTGATTVNAGTLLANNTTGSATGSGAVNVSGGMLGGTGSIGGAVNVLSGGTISAGASPGLLSIVGNYTQSGTLLAEIAGATVGSQYDQIAVTGSATLNPGATIDVSLLDGFQPTQGATFDILTATAGITNLDLSGVQFDFSAGGLATPALYWSAAIVGLDGGAEAIRLTVAVPEPSTIAILALGIVGVGLCAGRWRKRGHA
jgi:autotransporter-associated beta strand protein